jgi:hypothetical protein
VDHYGSINIIGGRGAAWEAGAGTNQVSFGNRSSLTNTASSHGMEQEREYLVMASHLSLRIFSF